MSTSSEHLSDLLLQWKELQQQGKEMTPEEMCRTVRSWWTSCGGGLRIIRAMEQMLDASSHGSSMTTAAPTDTAPDGGTLAESKRADLEKINIPGYGLLGVLDRGGMGVVYKAGQAQLKRTWP